MLELEWKTIGRARPVGAEVPPVSMSLEGYVLAHDPRTHRTLYLCGTGYDGFGETWSFDGARWSKLGGELLQLNGEGKHQGGYDSTRGIVVWRVGTDNTRDSDGKVPLGARLTPNGLEAFATTGDVKLGKVSTSSSPAALFGFDPARACWVCLTRVGVWELGADDVWVRRGDAPGVPPKWNKDGWGSSYDPVRKATVFWMFDHSDDVYRFFAWDGAALAALPSDGLDADELGTEPLALISVHPQHGLVLFAHDQGSFALGAGTDRWVPYDAPCGPPRMKGGHVVWDPALAAFVAGPGEHEGAGSDAQRMFYVIGATVEEFGVKAEKSPIHEASYSISRHAMWRGRWYAVSKSCLETWRWDDASGWSQIVTEDDSKAAGWRWGDLTLVSTDAALLAVRGDGTVFAFDGTTWTDREVEVPGTFADRDNSTVAVEPDGTLVLWGGRIDSRRLNDSFVLDHAGKRWRRVEAPSRIPVDFANIKREIFVDFVTVWDSKLGTVVRFGYADVAIRMAEIWQPFAPSAYGELIGPRDRAHLPLHDPISGETLLLDLEGLRVARFDVGGCVPIATVAAAPLLKHEVEEPVTWRELHESCAFDPARLVLRAQDKEDRWGSFELDLAPAFAAARALGARTIPAPVPPPPPGATLYRVDAGGVHVWSYRVVGAKLEATAGPAAAQRTEVTELASAEVAVVEAARLEAARHADGYRRALELDAAALRALACASSQKLAVVKAAGAGEDEDEDDGEDEGDGDDDDAPPPPPVIAGRLGGLPNGLAGERWPRFGKHPMGLLLQLETGDLVPGFAAVAVFCTTDGTATEDETTNAAILLTAAELAGPETAAPAGVAVMPPRAISIDAPLGEIDEARMAPLVDHDLHLAAALDALQASGDGMQAGHLSNKRGGLPAWVQSPERDNARGFVLQLDFDGILLDESWGDAGLSGCIFVFVDGDHATAFWQYT